MFYFLSGKFVLVQVVAVNRKSAVLKAPAFGCLKGIPAVNVTRNCLHQCVYCYARTFPETPQKEVHLYANLPELLRQELARGKLRARLPKAAAFSTASDAFQPHGAILKTTLKAMELLLKYGVMVSFLTKGRIPKECWSLFAEYQGLVKARFGLVSLDLSYHKLFEPHTASPFLRLRQVEKAARLGLSPQVRVDPVIPGITDSPETIESLMRHLAGAGVAEVSVSYLVLRPGLARQMPKRLPPDIWRPIHLAFKGEPYTNCITSARTRLARLEIRKKGYKLFREIGKAYGISVRVCGCKNPDLPFEYCAPWEVTSRPAQGYLKQRNLFGRTA
ncbi:SPL family radical SAM protein [Thermodesulfatator atlanticus]|uniref:SPL family radical SAM protein n=1 Tax=Thermodesulfatator atlanticus TaxID=501497 RepID=UPI001C597689|nr:radical SAM protein [Thermodesulfatator atlanticus]